MPEIKWKDLYLATNIDELQKHAAAPMDERLNKKECLPSRLYRILDKCLEKYKEFEKQKDLEYMYVYLFKYLQLVKYLQDNTDDPKYLKCRVGSEPKHVVQKLEKLHNFLCDRYQELENKKALNNGNHLKVNDEVNPSDDAIQNLKNKQNDDFSSQKKLKSNDDDDFGVNYNSDFIDCKTLKSLIDMNSANILLIIDVRTESDYTCRITGTYSIINVPPEIIKKGVSANELRKELPENSQHLWDKRGKFDCIVLADSDTDQHTFNSDTPVHILRTILTEWDYPRVVKNKPLILLGGMSTWFDLYSFNVTMPSLIKLMKSNLKAPPKTPVIELDDIEYPDSDEESKRKDVIMKETPNENALTIVSPIPHTGPKTVIPPTPSPLPPFASTAASTITINSQSSTSVPRFDRSVKPNLERKLSFDKSTPRKPFESITDVHKRHVNKPNDNTLSKLLSYNQDEDDDYRPFSPNLSSVSTNKENQSSILNTTIESSKSNLRKNDTGTEHVPLKFDGSTSGSTLKKSLSSPNINKADDNMAVHVPKTPPTCDRTKKPVSVPPSDSPQYGIQDKQYRTQGELEGAVVGVNVSRGLTGLKNLGNSCYMNSILQCISNTTELRQELCKFCPGAIKNNQKSKTDGIIAREVERVIRTLWYGNIKYFSCVDLKSVVGRFRSSFKGFEQQDSHEFFTILMDWLHEDLNEPSPKGELLGAVEETGEKAWGEFKKNNSSIVQNLFYGQQKSTVKCDHCGKQSVTFEPFSNLSLLLPNNKDSCTLSECLCLYLREETINGWNCPDCKTARNATKKVDITRLPPVLVIHLKRFTSNGWCRKKQTFVDFPLESLNMKQYTVHGSEQRNEMFNLYAISNHYGTMESGHYTAYCYNAELNRWFKFDDQEVTDISPSDVRTSAAYILFYSALKR